MNGKLKIFKILTSLITLQANFAILGCELNLCSQQPSNVVNESADISFNFENASLEIFLKEISAIFQVNFIQDQLVKPENATNPAPKENSGDIKITFRTNQPLTIKQAWGIVDNFLEIAGLARVAIDSDHKVFRISKTEVARKEAIPSFIGTELKNLPHSGLIRYVYFLKNSNCDQMKSTIDSFKSKQALLNVYPDLNALIFTDHAYNIKTIMSIVQELDSACSPVALSILKLKEADAVEVAQFYDDLKTKGSSASSSYGSNKNNTQHFLQESNVFAEPRTNTLIIIGPPDANEKIEKFIIEHVDVKLAKKRCNVHTIELNHIPAEQIATIFNELAKFGNNTDAAKFGSTRGGEKYLSKMYFEPEKQGNNLIVRGEEEDFLVVKKIIEDLDKPQPQVALDVLIVTLEDNNTAGIGSQIDNKNNKNVNFQTSGFGGTGAGDGSDILLSPTNSLASNLISLATSAATGSTVLSLGRNSVWALLSVLNQNSKTNVLSNPFLVTTNKYPAFVSLGEKRRITTEVIQASTAGPTDGKGTIEAALEVKITPRINAMGTINLIIDVIIENFIYPYNDPGNGNISARTLHTNASVADGEVLAIGGLSRNINKNTNTSVPILGKIPLFGNFFKNQSQKLVKENLIIFITPKIIYPGQNLNAFTQNKANLANDMLTYTDQQAGLYDPVSKWVFKKSNEHEILADFTKKNQVKPSAAPARQAISQAMELSA